MAASARAKPGASRSLGDTLYPYAYIAPGILALTVASFVPIAFTVFIAFTCHRWPFALRERTDQTIPAVLVKRF